jgi:hypothetical protein
VFFLDHVVEGLDLVGLEQRYARRAENAHPPRMLLKVWLFGAIEEVYSGRELARRLRWDLRFRYLAGGRYPDFRTINRSRALHREDFAEVLHSDGAAGPSGGAGEAGARGRGRQQAAGEHLAAQGDEPRADAGDGGAARARDRADPRSDGRADQRTC